MSVWIFDNVDDTLLVILYSGLILDLERLIVFCMTAGLQLVQQQQQQQVSAILPDQETHPPPCCLSTSFTPYHFGSMCPM